jgi:transcriptional/translational regulatory protein YebC/TACO1
MLCCEGKRDEVLELVAAFDGDDDVQNVYTNLA